jgi:hypothetical protein
MGNFESETTGTVTNEVQRGRLAHRGGGGERSDGRNTRGWLVDSERVDGYQREVSWQRHVEAESQKERGAVAMTVRCAGNLWCVTPYVA